MPERSQPNPSDSSDHSDVPLAKPRDDIIIEESEIKKGSGGTTLYSPKGRPDIVGRYPSDPDLPRLDDENRERSTELTKALFTLQEKYHITFPGIGNMVPQKYQDYQGVDRSTTYITSRYVEGANMRDEMSKVPPEIILQTFDAMIRYYEDAMRDTSNTLYLADLSLRQCIYGRVGDEAGEPQVYFFDLDPRLSNKAREEGPMDPDITGFGDGIAGLVHDIYTLEKQYPDRSFSEFKTRLKALNNRVKRGTIIDSRW